MTRCHLRYSEPLLREAVRAYYFRAVVRRLGIPFFVVLAILIAVTVPRIARGDEEWTVGLFIATVIFVGAFLATIYVAHFRNTIGRFRRMRSPEATFGYDEHQFMVSSELGTATMPWSAISEVWRFPRFWLLLFSGSQFATLPHECLDEPARVFITRKTSEGDV